MNILRIFIASYTSLLLFVQNVFASEASPTKAVKINCYGLPWCPKEDIAKPTDGLVGWKYNVWWEYILDIIHLMLQYVSVIAVIALMLSWFLYLLSGGEEEKTKKAKNWIIWSLVWVLVALSSNFLVTTIINFNFN